MASTQTTARAPMAERDHNGRLGRLEFETQGLITRVGSVETTLQTHGTLLYEIRTAVTAQAARSSSAISEWIRTGSSLATTLAIIAGLLIYVAKSVAVGEYAATMAEIRVTQKYMDRRMDSLEVTRLQQPNASAKSDRQ